jgi:hypothetical protein
MKNLLITKTNRMAHLHTLHIRPQVYVDLLEGDDKHPYYLYVGATEDYVRRYHQKIQSFDDFTAGDNDGWSTPDFCRKNHRVKATLSLTFVDGGKTCAAAERDTFMKWFHVLDCNMEQVRGADWCRPVTLQWSDSRFYGRKGRGSTLRAAYDAWVEEGAAAAVDAHKQAFLAYIQALL